MTGTTTGAERTEHDGSRQPNDPGGRRGQGGGQAAT